MFHLIRGTGRDSACATTPTKQETILEWNHEYSKRESSIRAFVNNSWTVFTQNSPPADFQTTPPHFVFAQCRPAEWTPPSAPALTKSVRTGSDSTRTTTPANSSCRLSGGTEILMVRKILGLINEKAF